MQVSNGKWRTTSLVSLFVFTRNSMVHRTILWIVILGDFAGLLWAWASIPFVSPDLCLLFAAVGALVLPVMVVLRWNLRGVPIGSLLILCSLLVVRRVGTALDPTFRGEDAVTYSEAILVFWAVGFVFCCLTYGVKRLVLRLLS